MDPTKHSFFRGAALTGNRFSAVAYVDGLERPDDPSSTMILTEFDASTGEWISNQIEQARIEALASWSGGEGVEGRALDTDGAVYATTSGAKVGQIEPATPTAFHALASNVTDMVAIGDGGHFYRSQNGRDFGLITDAHLSERPKFGAPPSEFTAYYARQFFVVNAAMDRAGHVAMATDSGIKILTPDGQLTEETAARILVGASWDPRSDTFWFSGLSPKPKIWTGKTEDGFEQVFEGVQGESLFTSIASSSTALWVGDNTAPVGGVWSADINNPNELSPIEFPAEFPASVVWKVDVVDDIVWVLRSKDLLRLENGVWDRFEPTDQA